MSNPIVSLWQKIEAWFVDEEQHVVEVLKPILSAYFKNLETIGIADGVAFLKAAGPVALQAAMGAVAGGITGGPVLAIVTAALAPVAAQYGAQLSHDAYAATMDATALLLHQPAVAARNETPAP